MVGLTVGPGGGATLAFSSIGTPSEPLFATFRALVAVGSADGSWLTPSRLGPEQSFRSLPQAVAADGRGGAFVAWSSDSQISVSRYSSGTGWSRGDFIASVVPDSVNAARMAAAGDDALLIWVDDRVHAARRRPDGAWSDDDLAERSGIALAGSPGLPLVLLSRGDGLSFAVTNSTGSWRPPAPVPMGAGVGFGQFDVAADAGSRFQAVWARPEAGSQSMSAVIAAAYTLDRGWEPSAVLERTGSPVTGPWIASGPDGQATAFWVTAEGRLRASRFARDRGWEQGASVAGATIPRPTDPRQVAAVVRGAVDGRGRTVLVWGDTERGQVLWSIAAAAGDWRPAQALAGSARYGGSLLLSGEASGVAVAAWAQTRSCSDCGPFPREIWSARFAPD